MDNYQKALKKIECAKLDGPLCYCVPIPGPTARCNKSSIYFFKW